MKHNWEYKRLGEVCDVRDGTHNSPVYIENGVPLITSKNIIGNHINFSNANYISEQDAYEINKRSKVDKGDIIMPMIGTIGNPIINDSDLQFCIKNVALIKFCVASPLNKFMLYILKSHIFADYVINNNRGVTQKFLALGLLRSFEIPIPPMKVQEHIVAELDELNGVIDAKREQLKQLDLLAQSIYVQLFGNWTELEPLSYYVSQLTGGKSLASLEPCLNKVLKSGAVSYDYFDGSSTKFLPQDYMPLENHRVKVGDVIISRMNTAELVGACAYVFNVEDNIYLPDRLWRIEYKPNANPIFLWKSLISETSKKQIRAKASGTSGSMKNISKPLLLSVQIPKVPLSLQQQFAVKVEAIEAQKADIEASIKQLQTLLDSRMDYWFN